MIAGIICNRDSASDVLTAGVNQIGQALRRITHGIDVHSVQTGAHNAAQAGSSKVQHRCEPLADFLFIVRDSPKLILGRCIHVF